MVFFGLNKLLVGLLVFIIPGIIFITLAKKGSIVVLLSIVSILIGIGLLLNAFWEIYFTERFEEKQQED